MTKLGLSTDDLLTYSCPRMYWMAYLIHALQSKTLMFSFFWPLKLTLFGQYGWWLTASECIIKIVVVMISTYKMCVQFSLLHKEFSSVFDCSSKKIFMMEGKKKLMKSLGSYLGVIIVFVSCKDKICLLSFLMITCS